MPSINIKEIDSTTANEIIYNDFVVLVAGKSTHTGDESGDIEVGFTKLYEDVTTFESEIGSATDLGFKMAKKLLGLGMKVQYVVYATKYDLEDAESGSDFWGPFEDKGIYDIRFIVSGETSKVITEKMIKTAAERGDAIALIDVPSTEDTVDKIEAWVASIAAVSVTRADGTVENGFKYAAAFAPHVVYNGDTTAFPGSFNYLSCFATHISRFPAWFAMAGSVRGVSPYTIDSVSLELGDAANAVLQARAVNGGTITSAHRATNTVCEVRPYGKIIWGNRTLFPLGTGLVASSFLNIRQLCCSIKKTLYRAGRKFSFEPNSDVLWANFQNAIIPLLEEMKSGQGIRGYRIIRESTSAKATLKAKIRIIPIEAVEDFDLTVELSDSIEVNE